jgi:hypothetical protein
MHEISRLFGPKLQLLLRGGTAQGVPSTETISDLLCFPIWFLIISDSSTKDLWQ